MIDGFTLMDTNTQQHGVWDYSTRSVSMDVELSRLMREVDLSTS